MAYRAGCLAFVLIIAPLGLFVGRIARQDTPGRRAVVFSGVTRNSLVVLPLALARPSSFALTPLMVVMQTLVELVVMVPLYPVSSATSMGQGSLCSHHLLVYGTPQS